MYNKSYRAGLKKAIELIETHQADFATGYAQRIIQEYITSQEDVYDLAKKLHYTYQKSKGTSYTWDNLTQCCRDAVIAQAEMILENYKRKEE